MVATILALPVQEDGFELIWIAGETVYVVFVITIISLPVSICIHLDIFTVWTRGFFNYKDNPRQWKSY